MKPALLSSSDILLWLPQVALFCISVSIVGLTAYKISFPLNRFRDHTNEVKVRYEFWNNDAQERVVRSETMDPLPLHFTLVTSHALLATGIIGSLYGILSVYVGINKQASALHFTVCGKSVSTYCY